MEALALAILAGTSGGMLYAKHTSEKARRGREGFQGLVNSNVAKAFNPSHVDYVEKGASRFNPIQNLMDPMNNVLLPSNFKPSDVKAKERRLRQALGSAIATPNDPSFELKKDPNYDILLNAAGKGTALNAIKTCESIQSIDCNAFDKEDFALSCGICFEDGTTASGNPTVGGLYVTEDDRASAEVVAKRMNSRTVNYRPSTGRCASGKFVTTKDQCIALKKKLDCEKNQSFDNESCSQCYQDQTFHYISKDLLTTSPRLVLNGTGNLSIVKVGSNSMNAKTTLSSSSPTTIELPDFLEGDVLQLSVEPETASLAGYLIGQTPSGEFRIDIVRLIQTDMVTGTKPRLAGVQQVGDDTYTLLKPGRGQTSMKLALLNTFTFLEITEQEAIDCGSAPYITKEASSQLLESSPCFKKGQKPGSYSTDCLQRTFVDAGCTEQGEAYPTDTAKAQALMTGSNGKLLTIGQIAGTIYEKSTVAYTGRLPNGTKLPVQEWDKVSRFCTGKGITSPCDFDNKDSGPLSVECLSYLWKNVGATENLPGNVGSTYTSSDKQASITQNNLNRFCTENGSLAPVDASGNTNEAAVKLAQSKGGVDAVKAFYNSVHQMANDNTKTDDERKSAVQQCYGIGFQPIAQNVTDSSVNLGGSCTPQMLLDSITSRGERNNVEIGTPVLRDNWVLSFTINPSAVRDKYTEPLVFTDSRDYINREGTLGSRSPLISILPNTTQWVLSIWTTQDVWSSPTFPALPLNKDTMVTIMKVNKSIIVRLSGGVELNRTLPFDRTMYKGTLRVVANRLMNMGHVTSFQGTLKNISFCSYDGGYTNVLDSKPGRTKSDLKTAKSFFNREGTDFPFNDIKFEPNRPWDECADVCVNTPGCVAYTTYKENGRGCWYKSKLENMTPNRNRDTYEIIDENAPPITENWNPSFPSAPVIRRGQVIAQNVLNTGNYVLQFDITPRGLQSDWGSIFHFTRDNQNCCNPGSRMPGIWFHPNRLNLHISIGDMMNGNWVIDTDPIPMGQKSTVRIECNGKNVTVTINGRKYSSIQPSTRPSGNAIVYSGDPWYGPAIATLENVKYRTW